MAGITGKSGKIRPVIRKSISGKINDFPEKLKNV